MVVVKIELWPGGDKRRRRPLGVLYITNDGSSESAAVGNYKVTASHAGKFFGKKGVFKQGRVLGFARTLSPYRLVCRALRAINET